MIGVDGHGSGQPKQARLLVVDDDPDVREYIADIAIAVGMEVSLAGCFNDLCRCLETSKPDLIVIDLVMPGKDGIECLEFIASAPEIRDTPVLLISGVGRQMLSIARRLCGERGLNMVGELAKPFSVAELEIRLAEILARCRGAGSAH